jgi:hypothetical protein
MFSLLDRLDQVPGIAQGVGIDLVIAWAVLLGFDLAQTRPPVGSL